MEMGDNATVLGPVILALIKDRCPPVEDTLTKSSGQLFACGGAPSFLQGPNRECFWAGSPSAI